MEPIQNRIIKTELVDIEKLTPFQGTLKVMDDARFNKLRKSIIEEGFSFTVHVWENADVTYIIDGHQRVSVLTQMRKQGIEIPPITCAFVSAKTYRDAKKLVLLAVSQYGKIQKQGFAEFVQGEDFDFGDFDFPDLTFDLGDLSFEAPAAVSEPDENQPSDPVEAEPSEPIDDFDNKPPQRVNLGEVWRLGSHTLVCGDSGNRELVHSVIGDEEADCVVSDPPYGLSFMGKEWDKGVPSQHLWEVWHSRLKPGAHLLSFSGTRTYHLMTVAIENAGFEIRDMMQWIYGQGFPKSHDISKAIDKAAGAEREVIGKEKSGGSSRAFQSEDKTTSGEYAITAPATPEAQKWNGWGTALKPANEPICVAQKPISEKTIAANVLKHGTGGLNIDGTRIEAADQEALAKNWNRMQSTAQSDIATNLSPKEQIHLGEYNKAALGRFPSNVIFQHSDGCKLIGTKKVGSGKTGMIEYSQPTQAATSVSARGDDSRRTAQGMAYGEQTVESWECAEGCPVKLLDKQSGGDGASRFFYVAKPSKAEKGKENHHATVKPVSLMQYLVRMVTQPDGLVLEPFAGSGTTLLACEKEGMNCIAFELDPLHCDIILSRWEKLTGEKAVLLTGG